MFRISLRRMLPSLTRSYATAPSTTKLFPAPIHARYDPEEDPQLAGLDYPKVSELSRQTRSARGWWDSQERINFDEAVCSHFS